jgi:mRNA interferase RelE/StbE
MAEVELTDDARADLVGLDGSVRTRVLKRLRLLEGEPTLGKPLGDDLHGFRKLRVGSRGGALRIVYRITPDDNVLVIALGPRDNKAVYREASRRVASMPPDVQQPMRDVLDGLRELERTRPEIRRPRRRRR